MPLIKERKTDIFAHRGYSAFYPENTMLAFMEAERIQIDGLEFDVQLTKDRIPVVIHDFTLDRTTTGKGKVREHTFKEIKSLSAGKWYSEKYDAEKVPSLEEVLAWAKTTSLTVNIELKSYPKDRDILRKKVITLIEKYQMNDRVIISSFDHKLIYKIQRTKLELETAIIVESGLVNPLDYIQTVGVSSFHFYYPSMCGEEVNQLLNKGINMRTFTVNSIEQMKECYRWKCSGIFTDDPKLALKVREDVCNH